MATAGKQQRITEYTYEDLKKLVRDKLSRKDKRGKHMSTMIWGHPGIGKSTLAEELANEMKLPMVEFRLSHTDPSELAGLYFPDKEKELTVRLRPNWLDVNKPFLLFIDEINAGTTKLHYAAALQIVLDYRIGPWKFHPDTLILAAGNYEEDSEMVTPMGFPLRNRFDHVALKADADTWVKYATIRGVSPDVCAYIKFSPESLYKMTNELASPTPRSWERGAFEYAAVDGTSKDADIHRKRLLSMSIGEATSSEFFTFLKIYRTVDVAAILKGKYPDMKKPEPSFLYSIVFALANEVCKKNLKDPESKALAGFFNLPTFSREFQVMFLTHLMDTKQSAVDALMNNTYMKPIVDQLTTFLAEEK